MKPIESRRLRKSLAIGSKGLSTCMLKSPVRMIWSCCVCSRERNSENSSRKLASCSGRYTVTARILGLLLRSMAWYSKVEKSSKSMLVRLKQSCTIEAVPPPLLLTLCDSEKLKFAGDASIRAVEAFSVNHVSVRKRQDRLCEVIKSLIRKVLGVRDLTFHKAIEIVAEMLFGGLLNLMGIRFCLLGPWRG